MKVTRNPLLLALLLVAFGLLLVVLVRLPAVALNWLEGTEATVLQSPTASALPPIAALTPAPVTCAMPPTTAAQLCTSTPLPAPAATETPTPTPAPTLPPPPAHQSPHASMRLTGIDHFPQSWNNCGPATLAMYLSYYGEAPGQEVIGAVIKPNPDDKNVSPEELATYARTQGYEAAIRVNGNTDLLRTLVSNGIPVIIETWAEPEREGGLGHYRLIVGYDDAAQTWIGYDSYYQDRPVPADGEYGGIFMPYAETDALWSVFNRTYLLVYPPASVPLVQSILGPEADEMAMWQAALAAADVAVAQQPNDAFAWFNLGTNRLALGDTEGAATAYDQARAIGLPMRMLWYQFGPLQAYFEAGRYAAVIELVAATQADALMLEEHHYWHGRALAALGDVAGARAALETAVTLNAGYLRAQEALVALPPPQ